MTENFPLRILGKLGIRARSLSGAAFARCNVLYIPSKLKSWIHSDMTLPALRTVTMSGAQRGRSLFADVADGAVVPVLQSVRNHWGRDRRLPVALSRPPEGCEAGCPEGA